MSFISSSQQIINDDSESTNQNQNFSSPFSLPNNQNSTISSSSSSTSSLNDDHGLSQSHSSLPPVSMSMSTASPKELKTCEGKYTFYPSEHAAANNGNIKLIRGTMRNSPDSFSNIMGKIVANAESKRFLAKEGHVLRVLRAHPHPNILLPIDLKQLMPASSSSSLNKNNLSPINNNNDSDSVVFSQPDLSTEEGDSGRLFSNEEEGEEVVPTPGPDQPSSPSPLQPADSVLVYPTLGVDLHSYIREQKKLPEEKAIDVFRQILAVVSHCHSLRIVLRDLKLTKFFFTDSSCEKLVYCDVEGAEVLSHAQDHPLLYDQKGSPAYISPEVISLQPYDGVAADMWSCGVILYILLTSSYPFQDPSAEGLFRKIQHGVSHLSFPPLLSRYGYDLILQLLDLDPKARPSARDVLQHDPFLNTPLHAGPSKQRHALATFFTHHHITSSPPELAFPYNNNNNNNTATYPMGLSHVGHVFPPGAEYLASTTDYCVDRLVPEYTAKNLKRPLSNGDAVSRKRAHNNNNRQQ